MEKIINFMEKYLVGLFLSIIILCFAIIGCLILSSNKYEDDISKLKSENSELKHNIEILQRKQECNCEWYENFYYEHAGEVGAYE